MKTIVRTNLELGWSAASETTLPPAEIEAVRRFGNRLGTRPKLGVNEKTLRGRVTAEKRELFEYAMRETARTVFWESLVAGVLIVCAWGLCVLAVLGR